MKNSKQRNHKESHSHKSFKGHGTRERSENKEHRRMRGRKKKSGSYKRPLRHGDLRYLILDFIKDAPRHGYDMMTEIETLTKGTYKPSPGVMYPALELIQDMGWATVQEREGKKAYAIAPEGKKALQDNAERITEIHERLKSLSEAGMPGEARPLRMALDGLRHDVKSHMRAHKDDESQREKLAKIIAAARAEVAALNDTDSHA